MRGGLKLEETQTDFRQARKQNVDYDTFEKISQFKATSDGSTSTEFLHN